MVGKRGWDPGHTGKQTLGGTWMVHQGGLRERLSEWVWVQVSVRKCGIWWEVCFEGFCFLGDLGNKIFI